MKTDSVRMVRVDRELYDLFKDTSAQTGIPVTRLVRDAMTAYKPELERTKDIIVNVRLHREEESC